MVITVVYIKSRVAYWLLEARKRILVPRFARVRIFNLYFDFGRPRFFRRRHTTLLCAGAKLVFT